MKSKIENYSEKLKMLVKSQTFWRNIFMLKV